MAQEGSFAEATRKDSKALEELEQEDKALASLEADLKAAEARLETAESRFKLSRREVESELAEDPSAAPRKVTSSSIPNEEDVTQMPDRDATEKHHKGTKNAGALPEKVLSHERWLAKRAREGRVREATKRARDRLRRKQHDKRFDYGGGSADGDVEAAPVAQPKVPQDTPKPAVEFASDAPEVKEGAQGIADRMKVIKDRPDVAEKRNALGRVVTGGRDNYYTFDPSEVLTDLKARGLLDGATVDELQRIIDEAAPAKGARLPPSEWLAHAQKVSNLDRSDDKPFKESENIYLKWVEGKSILEAEQELAAAEAHLQLLLSQAEALNLPDDDEYYRAAVGEVEVDQDYAEHLEEIHHPHKESHGEKNTSTMTDKQVSCKRWEAAHAKEARDREHDKKARDVRREEARDRKIDAANVGE